MQLRYVLRSEIGTLFGPQGNPGGVMSWKGAYSSSTAYVANDAVIYDGRGFFALQNTTGNAPPDYPDESNIFWDLFAEKGIDGINGIDGTKNIWDTLPGTPERLGNTSFRISDTGNANKYDIRFAPGTIISWLDPGGNWRVAKVATASYLSDYVTLTLIGNILEAGFTAMKHCFFKPIKYAWMFPGNLPTAALSDIGRILFPDEDIYVFSGKVVYGTAPTTTGGAWDINDDGTSLFSSNLPISAGDTDGTETQSTSIGASSLTAVAALSKLTADYVSGHATTPGKDAYIYIWAMPVSWRYTP